jgi:hypothetical protein
VHPTTYVLSAVLRRDMRADFTFRVVKHIFPNHVNEAMHK